MTKKQREKTRLQARNEIPRSHSSETLYDTSMFLLLKLFIDPLGYWTDHDHRHIKPLVKQLNIMRFEIIVYYLSSSDAVDFLSFNRNWRLTRNISCWKLARGLTLPNNSSDTCDTWSFHNKHLASPILCGLNTKSSLSRVAVWQVITSYELGGLGIS